MGGQALGARGCALQAVLLAAASHLFAVHAHGVPAPPMALRHLVTGTGLHAHDDRSLYQQETAQAWEGQAHSSSALVPRLFLRWTILSDVFLNFEGEQLTSCS